MSRSIGFLLASLACCVIAIGCASESPLMPVLGGSSNTSGSVDDSGLQRTHVWGYWDVFVDIPSQTASAIYDRQGMFTANVVNFLNGNPPKLSFHINDTPVDGDWVDVDIDVSLTHPFSGLTQYNGYDVRGIFMGDGSKTLEYNASLDYPALGVDQFMLQDPDDGIGGPDGYSRWYNKSEFSAGGMPLFSYTPGSLASPGFDGTAILCPYKYFANGLGEDEDLWTWLGGNSSTHGVFAAGAKNTRNYYLRFPISKGVKFGYAVIADWNGPEEENHPSNANEAMALAVTDSSDVYYAGPSDNGGDLELEISVWDWNSQVSGGAMEDYGLIVESTVLSGPVVVSDMTPTGGGEFYSTYHVEIPADNVSGNDGNEYWVIVESPNDDYTNDFGVINLADDDPLAAFFRFDLDVPTSPSNHDPECDLIVVTTDLEGWGSVEVEFDASGSFDADGDSLTYAWDFNGDGIFGGAGDDYTGTPENPTHTYAASYTGVVKVKVTDGKGGEAICSTDTLNIVVSDCGDPEMPSGGLYEWPWGGVSLYMASGVVKMKGETKEYAVSWVYDFLSQIPPIEVKYGLTTIEKVGNSLVFDYTKSDEIYGEMIRVDGIVASSENRIFCFHVTGDPTFDSNRIYYTDWTEGSGFNLPIQLASWLPDISPWTIIKMTLDENDNPVLLCHRYSSPQLCVKHWDGSLWNEILIDDSTSIMTENYNDRWNLLDFAYQPATKTYWITNGADQYWSSGLGGYYWRGTPTIYGIASDGSLDWKNDSFFTEIADSEDSGAFEVGVYIDYDDPDCRIVVPVGCMAWVFNPGPPPGVFSPRTYRFDPPGNEIGHGEMPYPDINGYYQYVCGDVVTWSGTSYYICPTNFDLLGTLVIPDW